MTVTEKIASRLAHNLTLRSVAHANRELHRRSGARDMGPHNRRERHLKKMGVMLEYALREELCEPRVKTLRHAVATLTHCASVDHLFGEIIDSIATNEGSRTGMHTRHRVLRENVESAIARYADFLAEVDDAKAIDDENRAQQAIEALLGEVSTSTSKA